MNPELFERSDAPIKVELYAVQHENKVEKQNLIGKNLQKVMLRMNIDRERQRADKDLVFFALAWLAGITYLVFTL